ncbi:dehydration-responsive protein RD22-like [Pyrus ussuriensis x Pyrus communis]|uniref:Dehydration-responsive protein RD22-like n=1 Tax=Pyrus ussuriensis x Pyrus communis TaxID=2448454 RepID=A0A5N5GYX5_9ROSA|nr:dehydration-responsive protein RD22-like [Pyrus ussuriensis x Pyrus communis]
MGFHLGHIFALLTLAVVALASHAALPVAQLYRNSVLPNTQMPKAISELLQPAESVTEDKSTSVEVGNPGANKANYPIIWRQATDNHQLPNAAALLFLEKNIRPGTTMNWPFARNTNTATFLPRRTHFSLEPSSVQANTIKETIQDCEAPGFQGEEKYCATSLESMIDFTTSKLGTSVEALVSIEKEKEAAMFMHKYTIMPGVKKLEGEKAVVCHKQNYPYAVFYCHAIKQTRAYIVPLVGADGVKAKAVAECHIDTSEWNPKTLAFQVLKVKPGTIPICHFLPNDLIVWVPKSI